MSERAYKLHRIAQTHGGDLHEVIPPLVNSFGQAEAARQLGLSQFTISRWLEKNGYVRVVRYERKGERAS